MERSIDLLEDLAAESLNSFQMNRRGYLYIATTPDSVESLRSLGAVVASHGTDPLKVYSGSDPVSQGYIPHVDFDAYLHELSTSPLIASRAKYPLRGVDLLEGNEAVRSVYPFLGPNVLAALHARRCGWLSAQQLGMFMWERCRKAGIPLIQGSVVHVEKTAGSVSGATISLSSSGHGNFFFFFFFSLPPSLPSPPPLFPFFSSL